MLPNNADKSDSKNLILAIALSILVLFGTQIFMDKPVHKDIPEPVLETKAQLVPEQIEQVIPVDTQQAIIAGPQWAEIYSSFYTGKINLRGGSLSNLELSRYPTSKEDAAPFQLFNTQGKEAEYADFGWLGANLSAPTQTTLWSVVGEAKLTDNTPLTLRWKNDTGQIFERIFTIEPNTYVIHITDRIMNTQPNAIGISHYAQIHQANGVRDGELSSWSNFLGPIAVLEGQKYEEDYDDLQERPFKITGTGGWMAITGRYFMAALLPMPDTEVNRQFKHTKINGEDFYSATIQTPQQIVAGNTTLTITNRLYAGPKATDTLSAADESLLWIVDYGWFHVIAKPLFDVLNWFHSHTGNWGVAIILLTILLKIITFPLAHKSYKSMAKMKKLQPEMTALKEKLGEKNKDKMAMEMMALYKKHGVNPMSGCWPMFVQIPIFFAMYKVILVSFEMRMEPFMLWIQDLSTMDPFYVLPLLMGASMFFQMRMSPQSGDPMQAKMMQLMPIIFTVMFLWFPSGLVLYWLTNNLFSIAQQWWILSRVK